MDADSDPRALVINACRTTEVIYHAPVRAADTEDRGDDGGTTRDEGSLGTTRDEGSLKCSTGGREESLAVFVLNDVVEPVLTDVELVSPGDEIVPSSVEIVSLVGGTASTTFGIVSLDGGIVSQPGGIVPTTFKTVSTSGEMISTDDEAVPLNRETIPPDDETVPLTFEMVSTDGETVSASVGIVLTIASRTPLPCLVVLHRRTFLRPVRHRFCF